MKTGPVFLEMQGFFSASLLGNFWQWKLDPYIIDTGKTGSDARKERILIRKEKQEQIPQEDRTFLPEQFLESRQQGFFETRVYKKEDSYYFRYRRIASDATQLLFRMDAKFQNISLLADYTQSCGQVAFEYLTHLIPYAFLKKEILTFHGVLLEYHGSGLIISAASGIGKTTHARNWRDLENALIINGDKSACYQKDGKWMGFGMPWSGSSGEQINRQVPIKAVILLERAKENRVSKVTGKNLLTKLLPNILYPAWSPELSEGMLSQLDDFLLQVPVLRLECLPDTDAVEVLKSYLQQAGLLEL